MAPSKCREGTKSSDSTRDLVNNLSHYLAAADPGGAPEARPPPAPVKTSQKKDGCHAAP